MPDLFALGGGEGSRGEGGKGGGDESGGMFRSGGSISYPMSAGSMGSGPIGGSRHLVTPASMGAGSSVGRGSLATPTAHVVSYTAG